MEPAEVEKGLAFILDTIQGVSLGFEFFPKEIFKEMGEDYINWGLSIDLFIVRLTIRSQG